jgi:hypothetical protein
VAQDIDGGIIASDLEIAVVRRKPAVEYLHDPDPAFSKKEHTRCLLASIAGVTLHPNAHIDFLLLIR